MQLIKSLSEDYIVNRVIIGSQEDIPVTLSSEEKELFLKFLEQEKEIKFISTLDSIVALVKFNLDKEQMRVAGAKVRAVLSKDIQKVSIHGNKRIAISFIEGFMLSNYQFNKYFSEVEKIKNKLHLISIDDSFSDLDVQELINITESVFWARNMVNEPASFLNAEQLSKELKLLEKDSELKVTIIEKSEIESLNMGGLLSVNKGSIDPPTFTILEYKPKEAVNLKPIVLVGKGVVYDTGGLSLKPTANSMDTMKSDMAGAAAVAGAIYLAAKQNLQLYIIALIPSTDNRPGLNAYAPGDVITMFNGTTVEVLNTDAEGRMILADALSYSMKFNPELVIDLATLTGAANRAIGSYASIVMGNAEEKYFKYLESAGEDSFERVVRFPFWDEYFKQMESSIADLKNIGGASGGMITAGKFLEYFVKAPYIHIDIAGTAWLDKATDYRTKGGSGVGVRLLYKFLKNIFNAEKTA